MHIGREGLVATSLGKVTVTSRAWYTHAQYTSESKLLHSRLLHLELDAPNYVLDKVSCELEDLALKPGQFRTEALPPNFAKRAAAIVEAARSLRHIMTPQFVYASREAHEETGDFDDQVPRDDRVLSACELVLEECWMHLTHAEDKSFQNAVGKIFLGSFLKLCMSVLNCHLEALTPPASISRGIPRWDGRYQQDRHVRTQHPIHAGTEE